MVKIKLNKNKLKSLNEDMSSMAIHVQTPEEQQENINKLWDTLLTRKSVDLKKLYKKGSVLKGMSIPVAKMSVPIEVTVTDEATGMEYTDTVVPKEIALFCDMARAQAMSTPLGIVLERFNKPIIWSFGINTAASDGVRIAFNPMFAQELLYKGKSSVKQMLSSGKHMRSEEKNIQMAKLFLYVLMHEAYHQIYRHKETAERKQETMGGKNHELANIAMDAEINRDIEKQFPEWFAGATNQAGGIFDTRFKMEDWQDIFDAYYYKKCDPPQGETNPMNNSQMTQKGGQAQGQPQNNSQDNSSMSTSGSGNENDQTIPSNDNQQGGQSGNQQGNQDNQSGDQQGGQSGNQQGGSQQGDQNGQSGNQQDGSQQDGQSGQYNDVKPDTNMSDKSKDYRDAYQDELQKEMDRLTGGGRNSQNNQNDQDSQNQPGNSGAGSDNDQSGSDENQPGGFDNAVNNATNSDNSSASNTGNDSSNDNGQETAEQRAAREQARKDVQKAMDSLKKKIEEEMNAKEDMDEEMEALKDKTIKTSTSSVFGGADMLSRSEMASLAEEAGTPYSSEELSCDVDQLNASFNEKHMEQLSKVMGNKLSNLSELLKNVKTLANWKQKIAKHFRDAMKGGTERVRSKRAMSQTWRADRFNPYKERTVKDEKAANIFYLIDGSGSMYVNGDDIFLRVFKDILQIEKTCNVENSARAFFASNKINPENITMWTPKTNRNKVLDMLADRGNSGGTDIPGNVLAVTKLKKPYYYNNGDRHTTIMVFTDGMNNDDRGWALLKKIPMSIRKDLVFVLLNTKRGILEEMPKIMAQGIPLANIIGISTEKYNS